MDGLRSDEGVVIGFRKVLVYFLSDCSRNIDANVSFLSSDVPPSRKISVFEGELFGRFCSGLIHS